MGRAADKPDAEGAEGGLKRPGQIAGAVVGHQAGPGMHRHLG